MEKMFLLDSNSLFDKLSSLDGITDENEKEIKLLIEKAYLVATRPSSFYGTPRTEIEVFDLENISIELIEEAIKRVEESEKYSEFWKEIISLEYLKDNLFLLDNITSDDELDELF